MYAGVLPFAVVGKQIYFLIGKEHYSYKWSGSNKWSDFGGDDDNEPTLPAAAREFYEESLGFFGNFSELKKLLKKSATKIKVNGGYTFLLEIAYDKNLPKTYKNVYKYIHKDAYSDDPNHGFMEKTLVEWIKKEDLEKMIRNNKTSIKDKKFRREFVNSLKIILDV
jgi:hypothetical protein